MYGCLRWWTLSARLPMARVVAMTIRSPPRMGCVGSLAQAGLGAHASLSAWWDGLG